MLHILQMYYIYHNLIFLSCVLIFNNYFNNINTVSLNSQGPKQNSRKHTSVNTFFAGNKQIIFNKYNFREQ